jgi:Uma2 family endonuclease
VVIVEVLSDATRRIDEGEKREAYLSISTLAAYLLVETDQPRVVDYRRSSQEFVPEAYEGLDAVIPLDAVGVELELKDIYQRVDFPGL